MEYLILAAMAVLVAIFAAAALLEVMKLIGVETDFLESFADKTMEVLVS